MTPLHMAILVECFFFREQLPKTWTTDATGSDKATHDLEGWGYIDDMGIITDKGCAWLERALATPMPVQKWVFEEDEK